MIKTEAITIGEKQFIRTYSDAGMMIHGGVPEADYSEAVDPAELGRVYTETDIPIESDPLEAQQALDIIMGEG